MKLFILAALSFFVVSAQAQVKDYNKNRQIEQLQRLKLTVTIKIDSLQAQLQDCASNIADTVKKLDQLIKENNCRDKPDKKTKDQISKLTLELQNTTRQAEELQKKYDTRLLELDKVLNLQKDLEDKISALVRENDR